ncbi:hypothetical protein B0H10DRAFT_2208785 [Mycena sp. CBHHK59/15]|nr:hypothetical protein B0H10DRAFT_2208785 [Mycena sp. CBHHK59/15]
MVPPLYAVLRRRSLRRPALILTMFCTLAFMARFMRDVVFDTQHSTRIAFKLASGFPTTRIVTHTKWSTRTVTLAPSAAPQSDVPPAAPRETENPALGKHTYRADGLLDVNPDGPHPIFELVERAEAAWAAKVARASSSLRAAVTEYERRYKRAPPRGFDEWWYYAEEHSVQLPDEYDQIAADLEPFWGMDPRDLQAIQREWEAHKDSYTIGKFADEDGISMLNFTLPADEEVRFTLATGAFQVIELLVDVERYIPPFRAVFSPHDNPNLATDPPRTLRAYPFFRTSARQPLQTHSVSHAHPLVPFSPSPHPLVLLPITNFPQILRAHIYIIPHFVPLRFICSSNYILLHLRRTHIPRSHLPLLFVDVGPLRTLSSTRIHPPLCPIFLVPLFPSLVPLSSRQPHTRLLPALPSLSVPFDFPVAPSPSFQYELKTLALEAAAAGRYIDINDPPPTKHGWVSGCPPFSPASLDQIPFISEDMPPITGPPPLPPAHPRTKSFIHNHRAAMDPCLHPSHLTTHGEYIAQRAGPQPHRTLIPQFSYSTTPLHYDVRPAMPLNWHAGAPEQVLPWGRKTDDRLQWRGSNTGIWHAKDGRWRAAHRIRLMALASGVGSMNVSVLRAPAAREERVGTPEEVSRRRYVSALLDVAFASRPLNCEAEECATLQEMFEFRKEHDVRMEAEYKYIMDVRRRQRLVEPLQASHEHGLSLFKATMYPEWFTDRIAPWVHYIPVQNDYSDLLDALVFFRGDPAGVGAHDEIARRIASAGRDWSLRFWRKEDLTAYMFRLFLEYARVMSTDRESMSFLMWDEVDDEQQQVRLWQKRTKGE